MGSLFILFIFIPIIHQDSVYWCIENDFFLKKCFKKGAEMKTHWIIHTYFKYSIVQSDFHTALRWNIDNCTHKFHHTNSNFSSDVQDVDVWTAKLRVLLVWGDLLTAEVLLQQLEDNKKAAMSHWEVTQNIVYYNRTHSSHLEELPFHLWVDALSALLIAANNAGVWSGEQLQALHQRNNRLCGKKL